jgi:hypothetical protein
MEIKLINYLLLTYRMQHGNSAEERDTERERERERAAERRGEAGPGWRVESVGESRETEREREQQRESRDGERLGRWRVDCGECWRDRDRESRRVTGRGWRVESVGSRHSALSSRRFGSRHSSGSRRPAVQNPAGAAGGRRRDDGQRRRGGELKKKRRAAVEGKREILGKKKVRFSLFRLSVLIFEV